MENLKKAAEYMDSVSEDAAVKGLGIDMNQGTDASVIADALLTVILDERTPDEVKKRASEALAEAGFD